MNSPCRRAGMSPIELLLGLLLVIIIAAVLTPVLMSGQVERRRTRCADTIGKLGVALRAYAADHDDTLPVTYHPKWGFCCWHNFLYVDDLAPYAGGSKTAFVCEADWWHGYTGNVGGRTTVPIGDRRTSYRLVRCLSVQDAAASHGDTWPIQAHTLASVRCPALKILALERDTFHLKGRMPDSITKPGSRYNALYVDGHVKWTRYEDLHVSGGVSPSPDYPHDPDYTRGGMAGKDID